jgi:hypothetical protein
MELPKQGDNIIKLWCQMRHPLGLRVAEFETSSVTKPVLQALVLADHVYQDRFTGKWIVCGTFATMVRHRRQGPLRVHTHLAGPVSELPPEAGPQPVQQGTIGQAGSPFVYLCLTDIHDSAKLELHFVNLRDHKLLVRGDLVVRCPDPLLTIEMGIPLPTVLPMDEDGVYAIELLCEEELLGSWRVSAITKDETTDEDKP